MNLVYFDPNLLALVCKNMEGLIEIAIAQSTMPIEKVITEILKLFLLK